MRFGAVPVDEAEGAILAHAVWVEKTKLPKSHVIRSDDIAALRAAGVEQVVVARLEDGDLDEDAAAERIARLFEGQHIELKAPSTGRVNIHSRTAGIFTVDRVTIDRLNRIDPSVTVATLADRTTVDASQMVATVKIIPYAVAGDLVATVEAAASGAARLAIHPFRACSVGLIQTTLPGTKPGVLDKTARITAARLSRSGSTVAAEARIPHEAPALADAIVSMCAAHDVVIAFGASAMSDPEDVVPHAIRLAGGEVIRAGMPVDPGNLIVVGRVAGKPVFGAPGCARSPKENGFDWVLDRTLAGLDVTADDIAGMGVGGLLMEIPTRPQPRETRALPGPVEAVVLAAGRSSRMGGPNKLLATFQGQSLVRRTVQRVTASRVVRTIVVTGHEAERVAAELEGLDVAVVNNADFATGMASSLSAGIAQVGAQASGAMIVLADMPEVTTADFDRLLSAFGKKSEAAVRAAHDGRRGNPVILPRRLFERVARLSGDAGARHVLDEGIVEIVDIELGPAASIDVDTPDALARAGGSVQG